MEIPCVCYKTKNPVYYNIGTKFETSCDTFLQYQHYSVEEALKEIEQLNTEHPNVDRMDNPIDWNKIDYFFLNMQEAMY